MTKIQIVSVMFDGNTKKYDYLAPSDVQVTDSVVVMSAFAGLVVVKVQSVREEELHSITPAKLRTYKSIHSVVHSVGPSQFMAEIRAEHKEEIRLAEELRRETEEQAKQNVAASLLFNPHLKDELTRLKDLGVNLSDIV